MEISKCLCQVYQDHWVCLSQLFCLDLPVCPAWLQNFMNPKQAEIIRTVVYLPSFSPLKTKTWPLISRKNLPQREFITLLMEKLFLWKNPTSNSVSPCSIIITFLRGKELGEKKKKDKTPTKYQEKLSPSKTIVACKINTCIELKLILSWKKLSCTSSIKSLNPLPRGSKRYLPCTKWAFLLITTWLLQLRPVFKYCHTTFLLFFLCLFFPVGERTNRSMNGWTDLQRDQIFQ